jgi:hypothetical protein
MRISGGIPDYSLMRPAILAILLALPTFAQQTKAPSSSAQAPAMRARGVEQAPAQASAQQDKAIEAEINARLAKSKIGKDGFKVRVQGGVAYWEGSTSISQHKGAATRMAKSAGAMRVVNNIQISDEAKQKAAANLESGRRRAQVKRSDARSQ